MRISDWSSDVCSSDLLDEVGDGDAVDGRIAGHGDHRVTMAAEHDGVHILDRHVELVGDDVAEARRLEDAGYTADLHVRQGHALTEGPNTRIWGVCDATAVLVGGVGRYTIAIAHSLVQLTKA